MKKPLYVESELKEIILTYEKEVTTIKNWQNFRKSNPQLKLPSATILMNHFNGWSGVKIALGKSPYKTKVSPDNVSDIQRMLTKGECLELIKKHQEHLISIRHWNIYRRKNIEFQLPHSKEISRLFGSWNEMKKALNLELNVGGWQGKRNYGDLDDSYLGVLKNKNAELIRIITPYKAYLTSSRKWDAFREKLKKDSAHIKLPQSQKIARAFTSWVIMKKVLNIEVIEDRDFNAVAKRIKLIRSKLAVSQKELGDILGGISISTIQYWEAGTHVPTLDNLKKLAALGSVSVKHLLYGNNESIKVNSSATCDEIHILSISSGELLYKGIKEECNEYLIKITQDPNNQVNLLSILSDLQIVERKELIE